VSTASSGTAITITVSGNWSAVGTNALGTAYGGLSANKQVVGTAVMLKESN
jgi:hypothetical protein